MFASRWLFRQNEEIINKAESVWIRIVLGLWRQSLRVRSFHTILEKNLKHRFLRLGLLCTQNLSRKQSFLKIFFKLEEFEHAGFAT